MPPNNTRNLGSSPPSSTDRDHNGSPSTPNTAMSPDDDVPKLSTGEISTTYLETPVRNDSGLSPIAAAFAPGSGLNMRAPPMMSRSSTYNARGGARGIARAGARANIHGNTCGVARGVAYEDIRGAAQANNVIVHGNTVARSNVYGAAHRVAHGAAPAIARPNTNGLMIAPPRELGPFSQAILNQQSVVITPIHDDSVALTSDIKVDLGAFTNEEQNTRAFQIFNPYNINRQVISTMLPTTRFPSLVGVDSSDGAHGVFRVLFTDIRQARQAYALAHSNLPPHTQLSWVAPREVLRSGRQEPASLSDFDSQVMVSVVYSGDAAPVAFGVLATTLSNIGPLKGMRGHIRMDCMGPNSVNILAEYFDTRHADRAVETLNQYALPGVRLVVYPYSLEVQAASVRPVGPSGEEMRSYTGRSMLPERELINLTNVMQRLMNDQSESGRFPNRGNHNQVDTARIEAGQDVRTTVMLRNIPNKITREGLKTYLDETSFGEFDFVYLRIDFANNCNVGYAFINFIDPQAIIPFAMARAGQKWNVHDSQKRAEISYATIQGRDCLIQKFRNSSVMLEDPSYRPMLYHTHPSP